MNLSNLLRIYVDHYALNIEIGLIPIGIAIGLVVILVLKKAFNWNFGFNEVELNINLGGIGNVKITPNHEVRQIAHKAWTELVTRKAGLLFEAEHDVIIEVYNSWYQLFKEIRLMIRSVPASQLKNNDTKRLIEILVKSLNLGMRPHLTKWQARFRRWYEAESKKPKNAEKSPQDIQKKYARYDELVADLIKINGQLIEYTEELKKLSLK
ncbi:hypothetical protein M1555_01710 [Patescibacteria group bacterium]|nr:hypothetical protein [Patescibacteria group bacterium]